ncbi:unnamed protein product, partial [Mesorhabditis belari]|uniref:Uncharacterized protein n=1 Tax=Mesorhabditis belari TaxID=2138241 RepID=A0AAF3EZY8_9BILA
MPDHGKYSLEEFADRLAAVEEKFAYELQDVIECFTQSRTELSAKKLDEIGKVRLKAVKHLKKLDKKKTDALKLWKICNIYSVCAVDTDNAMREVRKSLRKIIAKEEKEKANKEFQLTVNGNQYTPMRRLGDDYRPRPQSFLKVLTNRGRSPAKEKILPPERPLPPTSIQLRPDDGFQDSEIYDKHKPTAEEAQRVLKVLRTSIDEEQEGSATKKSPSALPSKPHVPSKPPLDSRSVHGPKPQPSPRARENPHGQYTKTMPAPPPPSLPQASHIIHPIPDEPIKVLYPHSRSDYGVEEKARSRKNTLESSVKGQGTTKTSNDQQPIAQKRSSVKKAHDPRETEPKPKSVSCSIDPPNHTMQTAPSQIIPREPPSFADKMNGITRPIVAPRKPQMMIGESTPGRPMLRATIVNQEDQQDTSNGHLKPLLQRLSQTTGPEVIKF